MWFQKLLVLFTSSVNRVFIFKFKFTDLTAKFQVGWDCQVEVFDSFGQNGDYFLEVFMAKDFLDEWKAGLPKSPSPDDSCDRLIQYALEAA